MLQRMTQRRGRIDRGKHFAPGGLDVSLETLDGTMSRFVCVRIVGECLFRSIALESSVGGSASAGREQGLGGLAPRFQNLEFRGYHGLSGIERLNLLAIEGDLLLLAVDRQLARVGRVARRRCAGFRLDELDPQPSEVGLDLGNPGGRRRISLTCRCYPSARGFDGFRQLAALRANRTFSQRRSSPRSF